MSERPPSFQVLATDMANDTATGFLNDIVSSVAATVKADEKAFYNAAVGVAFVAAYGQTFEVKGGRPCNPKKFEASFETFLKHYLAAGNVGFVRPKYDADGNPVLNGAGKAMFEGTADHAARIAASPKATKDKLVNEVTDRKTRPAGWRLAKGLNRVKTTAKAIIGDMCANHSGIVQEMVALEKSGVDRKGLHARFSRFVRETYGESGTALEARFQGAGASKAFDATKWMESVIKAVDEGESKVPLEILAQLVAELQNRHSARAGISSVAAALVAGDAAPDAAEIEDEADDVAEAA